MFSSRIKWGFNHFSCNNQSHENASSELCPDSSCGYVDPSYAPGCSHTYIIHPRCRKLTNTDCTAMVPHYTVTPGRTEVQYPNPIPPIPTFTPKTLVYMWSGNGCDWHNSNEGTFAIRNYKTDRDGAYTQCSNWCQLYGTTPKPLPSAFIFNTAAVLMN
jgi:hypothetical protein